MGVVRRCGHTCKMEKDLFGESSVEEDSSDDEVKITDHILYDIRVYRSQMISPVKLDVVLTLAVAQGHPHQVSATYICHIKYI